MDMYDSMRSLEIETERFSDGEGKGKRAYSK